VEAVVDFRVVRQDQVSHSIFENLGPSIGPQYAQKTAIRTIQAGFGVNQGEASPPWQLQSDVGWRYQTATEIAQFRVDGFTFSKITPYTTWKDVSDEAFRLWRVYLETAKPREVSRVAVRYINRMQLAAVQDLSEYLTAPPELPKPIPQVIREYLTRVYVHDEKQTASAVILQALEPRMSFETVSILLDIDAFREVNEAPDDPVLRSIFEQLRELKNAIFFASITEKTAEKYE
jgi:uncharacterized protein (TIGR04255 family)